jgi:hypothetical protein
MRASPPVERVKPGVSHGLDAQVKTGVQFRRQLAIVGAVGVTQLNRRSVWLYPVLLLSTAAAAWFSVLLALDLRAGGGGGSTFVELIAGYHAGHLQQALGNLPEVVVAILGIAITVVSIIVQLSATRYTPRVTEMFFRDRTNLLVLSFFVVTSIHCIWATFAVREGFLPRLLVLSTIGMITAAILLLVPYFIYVFAFLDPERVVARLQQLAYEEATGRRVGRAHDSSRRQGHVLEAVEQLADVAVNAISQKDRIIASRSVDALKDLVVRYLEHKPDLPAEWFVVGPHLQRNPDFVVMATDRVNEIGNSHSWLEWKVLRQYQTVYNESLNRMRDINELVAINTRYLGQRASELADRPVSALALKFFNTYLRSAINRSDVRSAYNCLHQYRQLAEFLLHHGAQRQVIDLAGYLAYYGQVANGRGLAFVTETAAHDLAQLCEVAHESAFPQESRLLKIFLDVDKAPETEEEERSLRGVRKAQVKLATYYLEVEAESLARAIFKDMQGETTERLRSIRDEMLAVTDSDFWEVVDRGYNFDYLSPGRRAQFDIFFGWFGERLRRSES